MDERESLRAVEHYPRALDVVVGLTAPAAGLAGRSMMQAAGTYRRSLGTELEHNRQ